MRIGEMGRHWSNSCRWYFATQSAKWGRNRPHNPPGLFIASPTRRLSYVTTSLRPYVARTDATLAIHASLQRLPSGTYNSATRCIRTANLSTDRARVTLDRWAIPAPRVSTMGQLHSERSFIPDSLRDSGRGLHALVAS